MASSATATAIPPPPSCSPSPSSPSTALIAAHPRKLGLVKFFNSTKGYGFIIPAEEEQQQLVATGQPPVEVFVHHTAITGGGFKSLAEGEEVEYDLIQGPKGMQAANVSGPGGKPVQGDPNAHRSYHHRYQSGGRHHYYHHHQQQQRQQQQQQQQQHHHHRSHQDSNGSGSDGSNGHLGYPVYGMPPYGYPIYAAAAGAYMVPTTAGYYHHQFASSQSSPQLKPSIAMYYPYAPMAAQPHQHQQQQAYGHLSNSSSSSSSNHTATTCEPESGDVSPSC